MCEWGVKRSFFSNARSHFISTIRAPNCGIRESGERTFAHPASFYSVENAVYCFSCSRDGESGWLRVAQIKSIEQRSAQWLLSQWHTQYNGGERFFYSIVLSLVGSASGAFATQREFEIKGFKRAKVMAAEKTLLVLQISKVPRLRLCQIKITHIFTGCSKPRDALALYKERVEKTPLLVGISQLTSNEL